MNSHDRRVSNRYWPHGVIIEGSEKYQADIADWLQLNLGSCSFNRRRPPRYCWRPHYSTEEFASFARYRSGFEVFFRKEKDYLAFILKWS